MYLADLPLTLELERARNYTGIQPQKVSLPQMQALMEASTPAGAVQRLMKGLVPIADSIHIDYISEDHPIIGALAALLKHPEAKREMLAGIDEVKRPVIEEAMAEQNQDWSPDLFEWKLVLHVTSLGDTTPVDLNKTLTQQEFDNEELQQVWDLLMELNMLRMENRL